MITNAFHNALDDQLLPKRMIGLASTPNEKKLQEEPGLEKPAAMNSEDSLANIQKLIGEVFTTDDPEDFVEKFYDELEMNPSDDLNTVIADIAEPDSTNGDKLIVKPDTKTSVRNKLFEKFKNRLSDKGQREIDKLPMYGENNEVAQEARTAIANIANIRDGNPATPEQRMYTQLAAAVGSLGLQKTELERTNKLSMEKTLADQKLEASKAQLNAMQEYRKEVARLEEKTRNDKKTFADTVSSWFADKVFGGAQWTGKLLGRIAIPTVLPGLAIYNIATLTAAVSLGPVALLAAAVAAGVGLHKISKTEGAQGAWQEMSQNAGSWYNKSGTFNTERNTRSFTEYQNKILLRTGEVTFEEGQRVKNFKIPVPAIPEETPNIINVAEGGTIDGQPVPSGGQDALPGSVVTGTITTNVDISMEFSEDDLKANVEKETADLASATTELTNHNNLISKKAAGFNKQYELLKTQHELNKKNLETFTAQLMSIEMRKEYPGGRDDDPIKKEHAAATAALKAAQTAYDNSNKAMAEMDKVKRVFGLNEEFANLPVAQVSIERLYAQTLNPELTTLIKKLAADQDKRMVEAQKKLGPVSAKELAGLMKGMDAEARQDLIDEIAGRGGYLEKIKKTGRGPDATHWGKKSNAELQRLYPELARAKRVNQKLFDILIAVPSLTLVTRYMKGTVPEDEGWDITDDLREKFEMADDLLEDEEADREDGEEPDDDEGADRGRRSGRRPRGSRGRGDRDREPRRSKRAPADTTPAEAEKVTAAEAERNKSLESLVKLFAEKHLKGLKELLNHSKGSRALKNFVNGLSEADRPRLPARDGDLSTFISGIDSKTKDGVDQIRRWALVISTLEADAVVNRISFRKGVELQGDDFLRDGKIERVKDVIPNIESETRKIELEISSKLHQLEGGSREAKEAAPLTVSMSDIQTILFGPSSAIKDDDLKLGFIAKDLKWDDTKKKLQRAGEDLSEPKNRPYLIPLLFSLQKLSTLLASGDLDVTKAKAEEGVAKGIVITFNPEGIPAHDTSNPDHYIWVNEHGDYVTVPRVADKNP